MAEIKKTGRGYQVISSYLKQQTHSRLEYKEALEIKTEYEELEREAAEHAMGIGDDFVW